MDDYFFQCKNNKTEIFDLIRGSGAVKTLIHHALIVAHQLLRLDTPLPPPVDVARACLVYARKERNRAGSIGESTSKADDRNVAALELFIVQIMRQKSVLVEACLRVAFKELVDSSPTLRDCAEEIMTVALFFVDQLYLEPYCLAPDSSARACILQACDSLDISVVIPEDSRFNDILVQEIQRFLQMRCPTR